MVKDYGKLEVGYVKYRKGFCRKLEGSGIFGIKLRDWVSGRCMSLMKIIFGFKIRYFGSSLPKLGLGLWYLEFKLILNIDT